MLGIGSPVAAARKLELAAKPYATQVAAGAARDGADRGDRRERARRRRPVAQPPGGRGHRPLPRAPRARPRRCSSSTSSPATPTSSSRRASSSAGCASRTSASRSTPSGTRPASSPGRRSAARRPSRSTRSARGSRTSCARSDLPEKLFVVHEFTADMIEDSERVKRAARARHHLQRRRLRRPPEQDLEVRRVHAPAARINDGFKLFYKEDVNLMSPGAVLDLRPPPDLVVYE